VFVSDDIRCDNRRGAIPLCIRSRVLRPSQNVGRNYNGQAAGLHGGWKVPASFRRR